jgi:arginase
MMMTVLMIPYDSGHEGVRLGSGPRYLVDNGAVELLRRFGHAPSVETIRDVCDLPSEIGTTFRVCGKLATRVRDIQSGDAMPVVLSGNCFVAVGAVAGLGASDTGVIWCDAHGEYNTPETTMTGYLDGMGLATLTGECWGTLTAALPGALPVPHHRVVHVGGRAFDPDERERLDASGVRLVTPAQLDEVGTSAALSPALADLRSSTQRVYLHIDLDVLDPMAGCASPFASQGGLRLEQLASVIRLVRACTNVAGVGMAGYVPSLDGDGRALRAALELLRAALAP